jgi:phosphoesterase RecJ-like protein
MVYDLISSFGVPLDMKLATPLYISIVSDTGSFRYPNTTTRSHEIAAHLLKTGVDPSVVNTAIFESNTPEQIALLGECLKNVEISYKGRLIWMSVTRAMMEKHGVHHSDVYFFIDYLKSINRGEIIAFFKEVGPGHIEVSLRSKSHHIDVSDIAERLGGGGHMAASGATMFCTLEQARKQVINCLHEEIKKKETLKLRAFERHRIAEEP